MFSSTRLTTFVCIALGIAASAAPSGSPNANIDARSPDLYDLSGGVGALLLALEGGEGYGGEDSDEYILKRQPDLYDLSGGVGAFLLGLEGGEGYSSEDSDEYILKRQLAGLDIGSRLGANMGLAHAAGLGQSALGLSSSLNGGVEARSPDLYDLSGGVGALILGLEGGEGYGGEDSDEYILKRQPDLYDLSGGVGALLLGLEGGQGYGGEDSDEYILKRQLAGLDIGSRLGANAGLAHAAGLGQGAFDLSSSLNGGVEARSPDLYDLSGGVGALLLGLQGGEGYGGEDSDEYILKRQPDLYDLSGGVGALLLGLGGGEGYSGEDSDEYILKRQLAGLDADL
ncbi:hypothetical protein PENSPDRAFT_687527 [Peniophora sp. CONT]|nr:hypothetical protein PENSPDRAFT_687527 [Peniophora sp. CONT]